MERDAEPERGGGEKEETQDAATEEQLIAGPACIGLADGGTPALKIIRDLKRTQHECTGDEDTEPGDVVGLVRNPRERAPPPKPQTSSPRLSNGRFLSLVLVLMAFSVVSTTLVINQDASADLETVRAPTPQPNLQLHLPQFDAQEVSLQAQGDPGAIEELSKIAPQACTGFTLLNPGVGSSPRDCYVVGCSEGYPAYMRHVRGIWSRCETQIQVNEDTSCFLVEYIDGSIHAKAYENRQWIDSDCK